MSLLGEMPEGQRVRLVDEALEAEGTECKGTIIELVVKEVRIRFDDGIEEKFDPNDSGFIKI